MGALDEDMQSIGGGNYIERKADYSNMGNLVSHYSPGRNTLASSSNYGTVYARYRATYQSTEKGGSTVSSATSYDRKFGGTSSACPTSAGLIATKLQYNRGWVVEDVLAWIESELGNMDSSDMYAGTESSTATDSNWSDDYSLEGGPPRILWDAPSGGEPSESIIMSGVVMDGSFLDTYAISVTNSGSSAYVLSGAFNGNNVTVNCHVGDTLNFAVNASGHPFFIRVSNGGANVSTPAATNQATQSGTVSWTPDTAGTYNYQCGNHSGMIGTINVAALSGGNLTIDLQT